MTNIIEQLGGYDACKYAHKKAVKENKDLITCGKAILTTSEMGGALLEHRRQHNIYEIGDKLIHLWESKYIYTIKSINKDYVVIFNDRSIIGIGGSLQGIVRHATDEEIAQGYRDE